MAFSDYKNIAQAQKEFSVAYAETRFLSAAPLEPSPTFLKEFQFTLENMDVYTSEASRTEAVIFPILKEIYKLHYEKYSFWIQKPLAYDEKLSGVPELFGRNKIEAGQNGFGASAAHCRGGEKERF